MTVAARQRYTRERPCPVCGGHERDPRGQSRRCIGFISEDGRFARCSREEQAGSLSADAATGCYVHAVDGHCRCGGAHGGPLSDVAPAPGPNLGGGDGSRARIAATYDYRDEAGQLLFQVVRLDPKGFRQRRPDGAQGWNWSLGDVRRVLYRLPELLAADPAAPVFLPEGERDVGNLVRLGLVATTNPGGAGKWRQAYAESFKGRRVVLLPDNDEPGRAHVAQVARAMDGVAAEVRVLELPRLPPKGDVSDWINAGGDATRLCLLAEAAPMAGAWLEGSLPTRHLSPAPATDEGPSPWEGPIPFGRHQLPPFPVDRLPAVLRDMVLATAAATQTPADMAGMLSLSAIAVCCGGRVEVEVARDYAEPLNCYVVVVMEPGNRKTAVARAIQAPIEDFEREQIEQLGPRVARERTDREAMDERLDHLKKQAARADDPDERSRLRSEAGDVAEQIALMPRPELPRLLADDVTPEAVPALMAANSGRLGIISAEGGLFDTIAGRYSNGVPNLDVFLKGHAGDPIRVDRRNGTAIHIDAPALTIGLAVQPDVLHGMTSKPGFAGRGLIPRFWFSIPVSLIGSRHPVSPSVPSHVREAYAGRIRALLTAEPGAPGNRSRLTLSPAAVENWRAFYAEVEQAMRVDGGLSSIREWASKLPGAVARIAGLLHCAQTVGALEAVSGATMEAAVEIGRYLSAHALAAHDAMGADPAVEDAKKFVAWLERRRLPLFSLRDAYQSLKGGRIRKVQDLEPAIKAAEAHGYVRPAPGGPQRQAGRPAGPRYETNPAILGSGPFPQPPHNPQNGVGEGGSGRFGGNGGRVGDPERWTPAPAGDAEVVL